MIDWPVKMEEAAQALGMGSKARARRDILLAPAWAGLVRC
jgi:hypothetical protein